jgi:hypothetical protein
LWYQTFRNLIQYCPVKAFQFMDNLLILRIIVAFFVFSDLNLHQPFWPVVCPELIGEDTNESGTDGLCAAASASAAV